MPIEKVENPTCDTCMKPATHVNVGFTGSMLEVGKGWSCDEHSMDIDLKPIEEVFGE